MASAPARPLQTATPLPRPEVSRRRPISTGARSTLHRTTLGRFRRATPSPKDNGTPKIQKGRYKNFRTIRKALFPVPKASIACVQLVSTNRTWKGLTGKQLPSHVTVFLNAPWRVSSCPLCNAEVPTLAKALYHMRRTHKASRIHLSCGNCGQFKPTVASLCGHAARCDKPKVISTTFGNLPCEYCLRSFRTKRGLTQHLRMKHPKTYWEQKDKKDADTERGPTSDPALDGFLKALRRPIPTRETVSGARKALKSRLGWESILKPTEIEDEFRQFMRRLRKEVGKEKLLLFGRKTRKTFFQRQHRGYGGGASRKKVHQYRVVQRSWALNKSKTARDILDGSMGQGLCPIDKKVVESKFRETWSVGGNFTSLGQFARLPDADNEPLTAPITGRQVVKTLKSMKVGSAPGPDGVRRGHLLKVDSRGIVLARLYNSWMLAGYVPQSLKASRTTLIPKSADAWTEKDTKHWRPITLGSTILRVFTGILARRMPYICPPHEVQCGFMKGKGCGNNIRIFDGIHYIAKKERRPLAVTLIDMSKAFDSVPHELIQESLRSRGVDIMFRRLVRNLYSMCHTRVRTADGETAKIRLRRGVKQGDPLSPILFNLALDPLLYALEAGGKGFEYGDDHSVAAIAYADDVMLVSDSGPGMELNLSILDQFCDLTGLRVNPEKCHGFLMVKLDGCVKVDTTTAWKVKGRDIHMLRSGESVPYLGIEIEPIQGVQSPKLLQELTVMLEKLNKAPLKPHQRIIILKQYLIPRLIHRATHGKTKKTVLEDCDRSIRRNIKSWLHMERFTTSHWTYTGMSDGGLGIPKLSKLIPSIQIKILHGLLTSEDGLTNELACRIGLEGVIRKLWTGVTGEPAPQIDMLDWEQVGPPEIRRSEFQKWCSLLSQGRGAILFRKDPTSNCWCKDPSTVGMSDSEYCVAWRLRTNTVAVKTVLKSSFKSLDCRLCHETTETLGHIISCCSQLKSQRMANHNRLCAELKRLAEVRGWTPYSEPHLKARDGRTGVPDMVLVKGHKAMIVDVCICFETAPGVLDDRAKDKVTKYGPFVASVKHRFQGTTLVKVFGFAMGAKGKWCSGNNMVLSALGVPQRQIKTVARKFALLALYGSIKTVRTFKKLSN